MSKVRFFFSVFCVIQLFICSSKISYAVSPAGATDGSTKVDTTVTPGVTELTIARNVAVSTAITTSERCNNTQFCSWQEIEIRGDGDRGYVNIAFEMTYKVAKVKAKSPSGKEYNIEVFLVSNHQAVMQHRTMYTTAHNVDGNAGHILAQGSSGEFEIPKSYTDYGDNGQFIPTKALNKNNSSTAYWYGTKCPLFKCTLDLSMGLKPVTLYSIKARIPSEFNESELSFEGAEVLNLAAITQLNWDSINNNGNGGNARFIVSGIIKFPQTCAFSLSKSEITFGTVEAKYENGELGNTQSVDLTSTCTSLDKNARIAYTITPGRALLEDNNTVAVLERTESNRKALGLIFGFDNDTIDCFGSGRQYSWRHVFNPQDPGNSKMKLNFKLCQYGLPKSYGEKSEKFNIRITWLPPKIN